MGRVFSAMKRELMNYNVENRAHEVISKDKLPPAPFYKSTIEDIERMKAQGIAKEDLSKKHEQLNENLKYIHVKSTGDAPISETAAPSLERLRYPTERDLLEPESVPPGKISLKNLMEMLSLYQRDRRKFHPEKLASQYNLDLKFVEIAVDRYQILELHMPKNLDKHVKDPRVIIEIKKTLANLKTLTVGQTSPSDKEEEKTKALTK